MFPVALIQLQLSLFLKGGSRAARKAREGRRQAWRERQPPATFRGGWVGYRRRAGRGRAAPVLLLYPLELTSQYQGGGERGRRGNRGQERLREEDKS